MREIDNNNINNFKFKGITANNNIQPIQDVVISSETKEINDLAGVPEASLGKSQVSTDSLENDIKYFQKNFQLVEKLNQAIDNYADTHTEEDTMKLIEKMYQEFVVKK